MLRRTLVLMTVVLLAAAGCNEESADGPTNPASTLDISGDRDRGDDDACFFTADFWTHEFDAALDDTEARRRFDDATLAALLAIAALRSDIDFDRGDDDLSFEDAGFFLDPNVDARCDRAMRQHLALLLNFAVNGGDGTIRVDADGRGGAETDLDDAIDRVETAILAGRCEGALEIAARVNGMGCDDDDDVCFRGVGFWKHQFNAALGQTRGHQHVDGETLGALLIAVAGLTDLDFGQGDGEISFSDADAVLDLHGRQSECARAEQHYFALLLNVAFNDDISIRVDTGGRDGADADLDDALGEIEESILEGECLRAKGMAERINSIGCDDECDDDDHDDDDDDDEDDEDGDD